MSELNKDINDFGPIENWRYNPISGQPLNRGLKNFKNLFRKPTSNDWFVLFIIIMTIVGSYFYYEDTKTCRETLKNLPVICSQYLNSEELIKQRNENISQNNLFVNNYSLNKLINSSNLSENG